MIIVLMNLTESGENLLFPINSKCKSNIYHKRMGYVFYILYPYFYSTDFFDWWVGARYLLLASPYEVQQVVIYLLCPLSNDSFNANFMLSTLRKVEVS